MRRIIAIAVLVLTLVLVSVALAAPSASDEEAWLQDRAAEYAQDLAEWEAYREDLDNEEFRPLRRDFRLRTQAIIDATTLAQARARARDLQAYLSHPDYEGEPEAQWSLAKRLHTVTRRFGSDAKQTLTRHVEDVEGRLDLYP